jgi:integrase
VRGDERVYYVRYKKDGKKYEEKVGRQYVDNMTPAKVNNIKTEDLTADELEALLQAIDEGDNIQAANLMKMVLFTGMRRNEHFKLKWTDIDETRGFIKIADPKGGLDQKIPLNDATRDLLKSHPSTGGQYVFPGRGGQQRVDIHHQVNRIRDRAGFPLWWC